ncbi:hypothetical protein LCGC14_1514980 [marine sediment metagenome]|uniref:Uncharacterized protein n=1 Tax=marine sediment metagenome TaxID=412755 RepID=A0A0F9LFV0_9ZZZZ
MTIQGLFKEADGQRGSTMERAILAASLTKPWILTEQDMNDLNKQYSRNKEAVDLPENYQSVGPRGATSISGKIMLAMFPVDIPWYVTNTAPQIQFSDKTSDEKKQEFANDLMMRDLTVTALIESAAPSPNSNLRKLGFRSVMRQAIDQVVITGDALVHMDDDFRIRTFRRDAYITRRDQWGSVQHHITRESIDPLSIGVDILIASGFDVEKLKGERVADRVTELYTYIEWLPIEEEWKITQEIDDKSIGEPLIEKISPYFSIALDLVLGNNYGRGFVELNLGDLRSLNEMEGSLLDFAAAAAKHLFAIDYDAEVKEKDLTQKNGYALRASVKNGNIQDIGVLKVDKLGDFQVVQATVERKTRDLGKAFGLESELRATGDRVTALATSRVAIEAEGSLGALYAPMADSFQRPLIARAFHIAERDNLVDTLDPKLTDTKIQTGLAALAKQAAALKKRQAAPK